MKFARYLEENTVEEWKRVYINYRGLKKLIKRVAEHREARLSYEAQLLQHPPPSSAKASVLSLFHAQSDVRRRNNSHANGVSTPAAAAAVADDDECQTSGPHQGSSLAKSDGSRQRADYGGISNRPPTPSSSSIRIPPVRLEGTGLQLAREQPDVVEAAILSGKDDEVSDLEAQVPKGGIVAKGATNVKRQPSGYGFARDSVTVLDRNAGEGHTLAGHRPQQQPHTPPRKQPQGDSKQKQDQHQKPRKSPSTAQIKLKKVKDQYPTSLDELIESAFDDEERKMFRACDAELEKVSVFYAARELDAAHKYVQLARQLQELADHRREYRALHKISKVDHPIAERAKNRLSQLFGTLPSTIDAKATDKPNGSGRRAGQAASDLQPPHEQTYAAQADRADTSDYSVTELKQEPSNGKAKQEEDIGDKRRAEALAKMQKSLRGWDDETDRAIRLENRAAAMSHNPEAYYAARKKLKAAVLEYYKFLETLTNYKILNRTGFAKILKKFSKTVGVPCADAYYDARVGPSVLVSSKRVDNLMKSTEEIYTAYFEHGNRKEALNRLRTREDTTTHHFSVFRSGLYLGVALCATVAALVEAIKPETQRQIPQWAPLLRVYGAEFIPTAFALLFGLNLAWWHEVRINTVFIFEWDVRHTLDHRQYFEIPALLMLLLSLCFWVLFLDPFPGAIAPTTWPTVWLVILVVVLLNPLPVLHRQSRIWLVRSFLRVFSAGYKQVEFRDFFLGDELNSIAWTISNLWYFGCEWKHDWAVPDQCAPNSTYWTAALLSVPALLRLGQCIRRWVDSDYHTHLHLVNGGKYASAVVNNFVYIHYRRNGSNRGGDLALWLVFACIYSIFHISWDMVMDWSLFKWRSKHFLLRDEISFPQPVYYLCMVLDVVVRCNWIIYLFPGSASVTLRSFLAALLEMLRRVCWNVIRVENEQIGNTDSFKIIRDLPLPYQQRKRSDEDGDATLMGDDGPGGSHKEGIFASIRLASLGRKKAGIAPTHRPWLHTEHVEGEVSPPPAHAPGGMGGMGRARSRSQTILDSLRDKLVPDAQGQGDRLDDWAATKGRTGRDYVPRDVVDSESESELGGTEEDVTLDGGEHAVNGQAAAEGQSEVGDSGRA